MELMKSKMFKWSLRILPVLIGAIGGYLYYFYVGCNQGCSITGNPWSSTIYGSLIGLVFVNWKTKSKQKTKEV